MKMFSFKIISTLLMSILLTVGNVSCANDIDANGLSLFKPEVQPLVKTYVKNKNATEQNIVDLLNKEFGKEILYMQKIDQFDDFVMIKKMDLTSSELSKLKQLTTYLIDESDNKYRNMKGSVYAEFVEKQFGLR